MMFSKKKSGQSLVEVVVSIGIVILITSGVVALLVNVLGGRTKSFDRKKATELAQKVVETMVADKNQQGNYFWSGTYWTGKYLGQKVDVNYVGYFYNVTTTFPYADGVEAKVVVGWVGTSDTVTVSRLFTKYR